MDHQIRKATLSDVGMIKIISDGSFSHPWSEKQFTDGFSSGFQHFFVCEAGGKIIGFIALSSVAGDCEILNVAVLPDHRKSGIGQALVKAAEEFFVSRNGENIFLEVRKSNINAISLYEKCGFEKISERKNYYSSPKEDALIYAKRLK